MAIVKPSPAVSSIRGSLGGAVFRIHRGKIITYSKPRPRRPNSTAQQTSKAAHSRCTRRWITVLSAAQRAAWDRLAAAHHFPADAPHHPATTGYSLYLSENVRRIVAAIAILDTAPANCRTYHPPNVVFAWVTNTRFSISYATDPLITGESVIIRLLHPFSPAVKNPRAWTRKEWTGNGPYSGIAYYDIPAPRQSGSHLRITITKVGPLALSSRPRVWDTTWPA